MNTQTQSKHIVIVSHYYPPHIGGIEIVAYNQAKYLSQAGHSVTIVTSAIGGPANGYDLPGVRVVRVPALNPFEKLSIPFPIFAPSILSILRREIKKADIVHIHDAFYLSSYFAAKAAKRFNKPAVLTQHVELINHPRAIVMGIQKLVYNTTGDFVFRTCKKIITYNTRVREFLLRREIPEEKILTVQNGVDTELFSPVDAEKKRLLKASLGLSVIKKTVLFVGRYVSKKGFDKVLAARGPEYEIVCTGGNTPSEPYEYVTFFGKLNQKKLAEVYQAADIFLLPSESEGFPLSIQEAMASGLPIVTTNDKGYREYGLDPNLMVLLEEPSGESIRESLLALIDDDQKLEQMSAYSHQYAVDQFSWPIAIRRMEKIYDQLLSSENIVAEPMHQKPLFVTTSWDDGHVLDLRLAALLEKYDIKGTFYSSPEDEEQKKSDLLSPEQTKVLSDHFEIGAHTMQHKRLPELSDEEARREIIESKMYLEEVTGKPVTSFCYPCGDYRERHVRMVTDAGFDYARTIDRHSFSMGPALESKTTIHTYNHISDAFEILAFAHFNPGKFFRYLNNWDELAIAQFERMRKNGGVFHLWGHSWEIDQNDDWDRLERVLRHISNKSGVQYLTNAALAKEEKEREKNKPATILMAAPYFPPHLGGTQLYVYNIAKRLKQNGLNVIIATTGERGFSKIKKTVYEGLIVYKLPYWLKLSNTPVNPLWYFHFRKIIRNEQIDIVNAHTPVPLFADIAARATYDTHFMVTYHGGSLHKGKPAVDWIIWIYEHLFLWPLLNRAEKIICTSDFVRNDFLKKYLAKSVTITPGVDTDLFHPAIEKLPHEKTRLLFVASLTSSEQYKGLATLIDAAKLLQENTKDFEIAVVGEGNMREEYEARVHERGLDDHFIFKGRMMGELLAQMYASADMFVHPTSMEAFGMVIAEAMASALPVVSTNVGGIPLLVKDSENGFLVEPANPQLLAEKIYSLINNPSLAKAFGEKGRTIAVANFNWDTRARSYDELYTLCLKDQELFPNMSTQQAEGNLTTEDSDKYPLTASVVLLTYNGIKTVKNVLDAIFKQKFEKFEVICIDTSSSDGTFELLRQYPVRIVSIKPEEFGHGKTRNYGAQLAKGKYVVFVTQDAVPAHKHWLEELIKGFTNSNVAGVYGRQIPRDDENKLDKYFQLSLYGTERMVKDKKSCKKTSSVFSDANSAVRRDLLLKYPYLDSIIMSEDYEWEVRMIDLGYTIVYSPTASVLHSHSYTTSQLFKRYFDTGVSIVGITKKDKSKSFVSKGVKVVFAELHNLYASGNALLIPKAMYRNFVRFFAIQMGKRERLFSKDAKRKYLSAQTWYWK